MSWWREHGETVKDFLVAVAVVTIGVFFGTLGALILAFLKVG